MKFFDILSLSLQSIFSNRLRTSITVAIIAFGIMAVVGINTAIEAMKQKLTESFSAMGANGFTINSNEKLFRQGRNPKSEKGRRTRLSDVGRPITKSEAETFKNTFPYPAQISLNLPSVRSAIVTFETRKTNPTVTVMGGDENFPDLNGFTISAGRTLNMLDISSGRNVCLIGDDLVKKLFKDNGDDALQKTIKVNNIPYRIIGTLQARGSTVTGSMDNLLITSYNNMRRFFSSSSTSFSIGVKVSAIGSIDYAVSEAEAIFRSIRKLRPTTANNFSVEKSDQLVETIMTNLGFITISAIVIGSITLVGAAVGLMNIMLVSVSERTKEIGLVKAIGGKQSSVRRQFLYEAILISLMGAFFGIVLGIIIGNLFSLFLSTSFILPWNWVILGIVFCSIVGLLAGLYPSIKAANLSPIEALRYE